MFTLTPKHPSLRTPFATLAFPLLLALSSVTAVYAAPMATPAAAEANSHQWKLDKSHSTVGFEVDHLVIATVTGRFDEFEGTFHYDPASKMVENLNLKIQAASANTNDAKRDAHLKSEDFFDAKKFPVITFKNPKLGFKGEKPVSLEGILSMRGVDKPIELKVDYKGMVKDPGGNNRMVFNMEGMIKRKDFGINWNRALDAGGFMVGEDVKLLIKVEAIEEKLAKK